MEERKHDVASYFLDGDTSDVTIKVVNGPEVWNFPVHTLFLKKISPVFKAMLESECLETSKREIVIRDFRFAHVMQFLRYIYLDTLPIERADVIELIKIADKYEVRLLLQKCLSCLCADMSVDNVYELLTMADMYCLKTLEEKCKELWISAAFLLLDRPEFETLPLNQVNALLSEDHLNAADEMQVLQAGLRWINFNKCRLPSPDEALAWRNQILNLVRWNFVDKKYVDRLIGTELIPDKKIELSARIPRETSLLQLSKVLDFTEIGKYKGILDSTIQCNTALCLTSHETAKVFIIGYETDLRTFSRVNCFVADKKISFFNVDDRTTETKVIHFVKPYLLKKGEKFKIEFVTHGNEWSLDLKQYYVYPNDSITGKFCEFKFTVEGNILGLRKIYFLK